MIKATLDDLSLNITDGKHGDCPDQKESGYYFISCKDVYDGSIHYKNARQITKESFEEADKRTMLAVDDILVTNSGTIGRMALIKDSPVTRRTTFQKSVAIVKPDTDKVVPAYLYYRLQDCVSQFVNQSNGSAQKNLLLSTMRAFTFDIHEDKSDQKRIAEILTNYDALIENNQKQIKLLEEAAQRLYKEWFVDLHFPGYESATIVDGMPEGWKASFISDICETIGGGTPSTKVAQYYENGSIPWVTPTDITRSYSLTLLDTATKITKAGFEHSATKMLPPETILMTSRASVGYFGIFEYEVCTNQGFIACIPHDSESQMFLLYNLMNRVDEIRRKASGSTYLEISKKTFRELEIIIPDYSTLKRFQKTAHKYLDQIRMLTKTISKLKQARDYLLPKLMSGELEVNVSD